MFESLNTDNQIKVIEFCDRNKVSIKEGVNNILAEYFLEHLDQFRRECKGEMQ